MNKEYTDWDIRWWHYRYGKIADRSSRMGGPAAWKEMQKDKNRWADGGFGEARRTNEDDEPDLLGDTHDEESDEDVSTAISRSTHFLVAVFQ
jgi:hypothetical protein